VGAPLPDLSVDRGAPEPLRRLQDHVAATKHRVLIVAESEGRRESLLELLRDSRIEPPAVASLAAFDAGSERFAIAVAPLAQGFAWHRDEAPKAPTTTTGRSSSSPRPSCSR
jgi:transcription-repair coupling factor (superfamily II helicase)